MILICFLLIINFKTIAGLKSNEEQEFIKLSSKWRMGDKFVLDDCLFLNFGYRRDLPFMMISLNLQSKAEHIIIDSNGMELPTRCFFVLIAGTYVRKVNEVMEKVDTIADVVQVVPLATFIFGVNVGIESNQRLIKKL